MSALTVTSKGQITLRRELLRHLGIHAGDQVEIVQVPGGELRLRAFKRTDDIADVFGMLRREGRRALSVEDMNAVIARGWAGER